jgi:hypothetical protein
MTELAECLETFHRLEDERLHVLAGLKEWPAGSLNFRPDPAAWSAPEVLDHIVLAEAGTLGDVQAGLTNPHPLETEDRSRIAALHRVLRSDRKYVIPATATTIQPKPEVSLAEVSSRWVETRRSMHSVLEQLKPAETASGVFCHPFAGWMTFQEVLEHFSDHLYHHAFQLERIRANWNGQGDTCTS